jgi:hypothetical protein
MTRFTDSAVERLYERNLPQLRRFLQDIDTNPEGETDGSFAAIVSDLQKLELLDPDAADSRFDSIYILRTVLDFFETYATLWRRVFRGAYSESWIALQDAFDQLRLIRRLSNVDIRGFERQLVQLEECYPYEIFTSTGMVVDYVECGICHEPMDSPSCPHRVGFLYRGKLAYGIARGKIELDHLSIVKNPADKRCVIPVKDSSDAFSVVRFLSSLLKQRTIVVSDFGDLKWSTRTTSNPEYKKLPRNVPCFCGSGRKFKTCCINKSTVEVRHVDIVPVRLNAEDAVA